MKAKHIIISHFLIALILLLYLVGCASIPGKDWVCRHWVASRGERWFEQGKRIDIVRGKSRGEHIVDEIYLWEGHIKIEGERQLDTSDSKFHETSRWRLNQGFPEDEKLFMEYVEEVKKEGVL